VTVLSSSVGPVQALIAEAFERRVAPVMGLADDAVALAVACREMADRFRRGGRLLVFGNGAGATDAQHVAVEFVHPVIVGKRALPALSLVSDAATLMGVAARRGWRASTPIRCRSSGGPTTSRSGCPATVSARTCVPGCVRPARPGC